MPRKSPTRPLRPPGKTTVKSGFVNQTGEFNNRRTRDNMFLNQIDEIIDRELHRRLSDCEKSFQNSAIKESHLAAGAPHTSL